MGEGYYTAQICTQNGHKVTTALELIPEASSEFCDECGSATISQCPDCRAPIRGLYRGGGIGFGYDVPKYCPACGKAYPWTAEQLASADALIDLADQLTDAERAQLKKDVPFLTIDSPRTQVATVRTRQVLGKIRNEAGPALRSILTSIATDAVKKGLGL